MQDATKAGLASQGIWKSYPRNMLYARAMSNGAKWYCPSIFGGPVYHNGELANEPINTEMEVLPPSDRHVLPKPVQSETIDMQGFNQYTAECNQIYSQNVNLFPDGVDQLRRLMKPRIEKLLEAVGATTDVQRYAEFGKPDFQESLNVAFKDICRERIDVTYQDKEQPAGPM